MIKKGITDLREGERSNSEYDQIMVNGFNFDTLAPPNKMVKLLNFENKNLINISYEVSLEEVISNLLVEVKKLKNRVDSLEKINSLKENNVLLAQDGLKTIWDNNKDDIWNSL